MWRLMGAGGLGGMRVRLLGLGKSRRLWSQGLHKAFMHLHQWSAHGIIIKRNSWCLNGCGWRERKVFMVYYSKVNIWGSSPHMIRLTAVYNSKIPNALFWTLWALQCTWCADIHAGKIPTHIKQKQRKNEKMAYQVKALANNPEDPSSTFGTQTVEGVTCNTPPPTHTQLTVDI